jgi:ADP-ribose pyrophosphatase YjhB (NUDIX family)
VSNRLYPDRPFLAASVAVFREGYVLLASRTKPPADLLFSLPGGLVEPGETLAEAALRELAEEVGVEASIVGFNDHVEIIERDDVDRVRHHFVVASFVARWVAGEPTTGPEAGHVLWVLPEALGALATTPGLARIVANAKRLWEAAG